MSSELDNHKEMLNSSSPSQVSPYLLRQQRQRLSCLAGGGSGRLLEIILCIRARHGIIRGGTHFALPRDYHHPSGSGEQLCWVGGGRGSAEGRPKLIPRMPPQSAGRGRVIPAEGAAGMPSGRAGLGSGQGCGQGRAVGTAAPGTAAPRPCSRGARPGAGKSPACIGCAVHGAIGPERLCSKMSFAGRIWVAAVPACPSPGAGCRNAALPHRRHPAPAVTFSRALEFPAKWEIRDFSPCPLHHETRV